MKRYKRLIGILLIMFMMFGAIPAVPVSAASANVTIALSSSSVKVGDSLTVSVTIKCSEEIGSYAMAVVYDSSVIEYTGGSGSGGNGTVNIAGYGDGAAKSLKASLKFKAVGSGSTSVSTTGGEAYTWSESVAELSHAGAKVTVAAEATASTDNSLSALSISPGTLSPAFDPGTTSYTTSVGADVKSLVVSATANDAKAKVSVSGNKSLKAGENKINVTVTAESGAKKTYKIVCTKAAGESTREETASTAENSTESSTESSSEASETETTEEVPALTVLIDGVTYTFANNTDGLELPADFSMAASVYQGQEILAFTGPGDAIMLVCLMAPEGTPVWFMYDEITGGFMSYCEMNTAANRLFIVSASDDVEIPEGYRSVELDMNGVIIPGFINESNTEIILVYAKKLNGETGLYYYDTIENGFIRYIPDQNVAEEETTEETVPAVTEPEQTTGYFTYEVLKLITVLAVCLSLVLLFAWAVTFAKNISLKKQLRDGGESDVSSENTNNEQKKTSENPLEEKAAAVVAKLALDEEKKPEENTVSGDTQPVPIIKLEDEENI